MAAPLSFWIGFNVLILVLLAADLALFGRGKTPPSVRALVLATAGWIAAALAVGSWIGMQVGTPKSIEFFTGYLIEYALSLDNILLFVLIFTSFQLSAERQRRVLYWGVLGALGMRGLMILAGVTLIGRFSWIIYLFGAYIIYAGASLFFPKKHQQQVDDMRSVRLARRMLPVSTTDSDHFTVREKGHLRFTMLFLVLLIVEVTDLIFAFDSIPAIFGVTTDPFIVYTSNACAILGLRSLYFLLAGAVKNLVYLQPGLGIVLVFIGAKMVLEKIVPITTTESLLVVGCIFVVTIAASLVHTAHKGKRHAHPG